MTLCHHSSVCRSISKLNVNEQKALVPQRGSADVGMAGKDSSVSDAGSAAKECVSWLF